MDKLQRYTKRLDAYYNAETAILEGAQSYSVGSRNLTRANLKDIEEMIEYLEKAISTEKAKGRNKVFSIIPRDL